MESETHPRRYEEGEALWVVEASPIANDWRSLFNNNHPRIYASGKTTSIFNFFNKDFFLFGSDI